MAAQTLSATTAAAGEIVAGINTDSSGALVVSTGSAGGTTSLTEADSTSGLAGSAVSSTVVPGPEASTTALGSGTGSLDATEVTPGDATTPVGTTAIPGGTSRGTQAVATTGSTAAKTGIPTETLGGTTAATMRTGSTNGTETSSTTSSLLSTSASTTSSSFLAPTSNLTTPITTPASTSASPSSTSSWSSTTGTGHVTVQADTTVLSGSAETKSASPEAFSLMTQEGTSGSSTTVAWISSTPSTTAPLFTPATSSSSTILTKSHPTTAVTLPTTIPASTTAIITPATTSTVDPDPTSTAKTPVAAFSTTDQSHPAQLAGDSESSSAGTSTMPKVGSMPVWGVVLIVLGGLALLAAGYFGYRKFGGNRSNEDDDDGFKGEKGEELRDDDEGDHDGDYREAQPWDRKHDTRRDTTSTFHALGRSAGPGRTGATSESISSWIQPPPLQMTVDAGYADTWYQPTDQGRELTTGRSDRRRSLASTIAPVYRSTSRSVASGTSSLPPLLQRSQSDSGTDHHGRKDTRPLTQQTALTAVTSAYDNSLYSVFGEADSNLSAGPMPLTGSSFTSTILPYRASQASTLAPPTGSSHFKHRSSIVPPMPAMPKGFAAQRQASETRAPPSPGRLQQVRQSIAKTFSRQKGRDDNPQAQSTTTIQDEHALMVRAPPQPMLAQTPAAVTQKGMLAAKGSHEGPMPLGRMW